MVVFFAIYLKKNIKQGQKKDTCTLKGYGWFGHNNYTPNNCYWHIYHNFHQNISLPGWLFPSTYTWTYHPYKCQ